MLDTVEKFILLPAWRANAGAYKTTERYSSWKKKIFLFEFIEFVTM